MSAKKRPGLIVMKRLDTMGLRLLSQAVGAGTRRAGVRLSPRGELTPHQRGEPVLRAPSPRSPGAAELAEPEQEETTAKGGDGMRLETPPAFQLQRALSAEIRELSPPSSAAPALPDPSVSATSHAPDALGSTAWRDAMAGSRRVTTLWALGLLTAGVLTGVGIARIVSGGVAARDDRARHSAGSSIEQAPSDERPLGAAKSAPSGESAPSAAGADDWAEAPSAAAVRARAPGPQLESTGAN